MSDYEYQNEKSIPANLRCPLCNRAFQDPVRVPCAHDGRTFCHPCIAKRFRTNPSCPTCKNHIRIDDLTVADDQYLLEGLNEIPIKCLYCKEKNLTRGSFTTHYHHKCLKAIVACPAEDINCSWRGTRVDCEKHMKTCSLVVIHTSIVLMMKKGDKERRENDELRKKIEKLEAEVADLRSAVNVLSSERQKNEVLEELLSKHAHVICKADSQSGKDVDIKEKNEVDIVHNPNTMSTGAAHHHAEPTSSNGMAEILASDIGDNQYDMVENPIVHPSINRTRDRAHAFATTASLSYHPAPTRPTQQVRRTISVFSDHLPQQSSTSTATPPPQTPPPPPPNTDDSITVAVPPDESKSIFVHGDYNINIGGCANIGPNAKFGCISRNDRTINQPHPHEKHARGCEPHTDTTACTTPPTPSNGDGGPTARHDANSISSSNHGEPDTNDMSYAPFVGLYADVDQGSEHGSSDTNTSVYSATDLYANVMRGRFISNIVL